MSMCFGWTFKASCNCVLIQFSDLTFMQISTLLNWACYCPLRAPRNSTAFPLPSNYPSQKSSLRYKTNSPFSVKCPLTLPVFCELFDHWAERMTFDSAHRIPMCSPHFSVPFAVGWGHETRSSQRTMKKWHLSMGPWQLGIDHFALHLMPLLWQPTF